MSGGEVIGDGGEVPTPMSGLAGVVGEVIWQCHHDQGVDLEGGRQYHGSSFGWLVHGDEFPEEFSVPECLSS